MADFFLYKAFFGWIMLSFCFEANFINVVLRISSMASEDRIAELKRLMASPDSIRNICTSAHIHHGKTALTDNLLAASGFMSTKAAGSLEEGMATWQHADEQERLLTVDSANVSMVHTFGDKRYLINL